MTVYVLFADYELEGCDCLGVYQSYEAAEAAFEVYSAKVEDVGEILIQERVIGSTPEVLWL